MDKVLKAIDVILAAISLAEVYKINMFELAQMQAAAKAQGRELSNEEVRQFIARARTAVENM